MRHIEVGTAIVVTAWPEQPSCTELARQAELGLRPRTDYVELARRLGADVIDGRYMTERASPLARAVAARAGMTEGQVAEVFLRGGRYRRVLAWADRLGFGLALAFKLARSRRDLVIISVWLSTGRKSFLLGRLGLHSNFRAIVGYSSAQLRIAAERLDVPETKLHLALQPVDERFWQPSARPVEDVIAAVGSEARDYPTFIQAALGLGPRVELAVGSSTHVHPGGGPVVLPEGGVLHRRLDPVALRALYARSRFVVAPLHDVEYDAGVTTLTEAMAMGKAVIVTRTRGQVDLVRHGVEGLYVPPGDARAMRAAMAHLLARPDEAERMGRAGRARVEERHTLDAYVDRIEAIMSSSGAPTASLVASYATTGRS